jgi:hypothetical protein
MVMNIRPRIVVVAFTLQRYDSFIRSNSTIAFGIRSAGEKPPPNWPDKWFDRKFRQAVPKFTDTFNKVYLVAMLLEIERRNVFDSKDKRELEIYSKHLHGRQTIPIYLDSLLFYLRILADNLADLTPYLYPVQAGKQIANRSFRRHRNWFLKSNLDPEYKDILANRTQWFDVLAGKAEGEGLRDEIIHNRGRIVISQATASEVDDFKLTASIVGDSGRLIDDIFPQLVSLTSELFTFLDHYVIHFSDYVAKKLGQSLLDLSNPYHTEWFRFPEPLRSFWLFPSVSKDENYQ